MLQGDILCGAYISAIADRLRLLTDEVVESQTQIYLAKTVGPRTCQQMVIAAKVEGQWRWSYDKGITLWERPQEGHEDVYQTQPAPQGPPDSPAHQAAPYPRIITRQVPLSADYMGETLHIDRFMAESQVWQNQALCDYFSAMSFQYDPRPPTYMPYVPMYPEQHDEDMPDQDEDEE